MVGTRDSIFNLTSGDIMQLFYELHQGVTSRTIYMTPQSISTIIKRDVSNVQVCLKELRNRQCVRKHRSHVLYYVTRSSLIKYNTLVKVVVPEYHKKVFR